LCQPERVHADDEFVASLILLKKLILAAVWIWCMAASGRKIKNSSGNSQTGGR